MIGAVARGLADLREKVVFVGGATIDLYIDDPAAPETRPTDDVDCVVELSSRLSYHELEERLRALKFEQPIDEKAPICRWRFAGIKVDVMPTEGAVLGFKNKWYSDGMAHAEKMQLPDGQEILIFSLAHLLASKLEAFFDRGRGDFLGSADLEDIISLIDGCSDAEARIERAPAEVRAYLAAESSKLLAAESFTFAVEGSLAHSERSERCLTILRRISNLNS